MHSALISPWFQILLYYFRISQFFFIRLHPSRNAYYFKEDSIIINCIEKKSNNVPASEQEKKITGLHT